MKLYNTLTRRTEEFEPLKKGAVGMYVCGPTVYDVGHLGHARSAVSFDLIRRYLNYRGYAVTFVSNYTDVDDKMIARAAREKITELELAERIIPEYEKDYGALGILPSTHAPRATQYIQKMVQLIEKLMQAGTAYATDDGVYFEVGKCKNYGELSGQNLEELRSGARIAVDEKKKNPEDFALWKAQKPGEPAWDGPRGMHGRPGWHIECSAMSMDILGETFDIHGGGIDLIFPHHEGEIAQSEMATGKKFARYWLHNGHVQVQKEKMSKSLGNFFTIKDMLAKHDAGVLRYFLLSTHYRLPIDFSDELIVQAANSLTRLRDCYRAVCEDGVSEDSPTEPDYIVKARAAFIEAMDDDFEVSRGLAALFECVSEVNRALAGGVLKAGEREAVKQFFDEIDDVLAVIRVTENIPAEVKELMAARDLARSKRDFAKSDELRKAIVDLGFTVEDTPVGTRVKKSI